MTCCSAWEGYPKDKKEILMVKTSMINKSTGEDC